MMAAQDKAALENKVAAHYTIQELEDKIMSVLAAQGVSAQALKMEHLAPVDEFHIGGRQATIELMSQLPLEPRQHLLDIGSGIGGASRYLAATVGCRVTGIDLTPAYVEAAAALSRRVGLAERVTYRQASALALPFPDASFDGAYTLHVAMNIADKPKLYAEAHRVLKPGAFFAVYDVLRGPNGDGPHFPVPWADDSSSSFLVRPDELGRLLAAAGFEVTASRDRRAFGIDFFQQVQAKAAEAAAQGKPPLGIPLLLGADFPQKIANLVRSMREERVAPWEFLCRRP
jgi:SAM-dependent methyltransferase